MLKHRLARRLSTLFMLVAVLAAVTSAPAASTNRGPYCQREISWDGVCVEICCTGAGCMATAC
ncbi:MAG TPA: hypothetical protein VF297_13910 [Pyrinomonadaceae bacterium]